MDREIVEKLTSKQKVQKYSLRRNLEISMDRGSVEIYQEKRKKGSIEMNLSRIYWEAIELKENEFFNEEKHKEMNATSKLLKQKSNQHIKLSKHLSTYMQSIDPNTHTHTHTLNKSNQFYISKTS